MGEREKRQMKLVPGRFHGETPGDTGRTVVVDAETEAEGEAEAETDGKSKGD